MGLQLDARRAVGAPMRPIGISSRRGRAGQVDATSPTPKVPARSSDGVPARARPPNRSVIWPRAGSKRQAIEGFHPAVHHTEIASKCDTVLGGFLQATPAPLKQAVQATGAPRSELADWTASTNAQSTFSRPSCGGRTTSASSFSSLPSLNLGFEQQASEGRVVEERRKSAKPMPPISSTFSLRQTRSKWSFEMRRFRTHLMSACVETNQ